MKAKNMTKRAKGAAVTTKTATRTATATASGNPLEPYRAVLKAWPVKFAGPKPTAAEFAAAHGLGARAGTKTAIALAMYLRAQGASQAQVINVNGGPYLNKMRACVEAGQALREPVPVNAQGHTVYKLALKPAKKPAGKRKAKGKAKSPATGETASPANVDGATA